MFKQVLKSGFWSQLLIFASPSSYYRGLVSRHCLQKIRKGISSRYGSPKILSLELVNFAFVLKLETEEQLQEFKTIAEQIRASEKVAPV